MNKANTILKDRLRKILPKSKVLRNCDELNRKGGGITGDITDATASGVSIRICGNNAYNSVKSYGSYGSYGGR